MMNGKHRYKIDFRKGLTAIILLLYVFTFSGITGGVYSPLNRPTQTEEHVRYKSTLSGSVCSYKAVFQRLFRSYFNQFCLVNIRAFHNNYYRVVYKHFKFVYRALCVPFNRLLNNLKKSVSLSYHKQLYPFQYHFLGV